MGMNRRRWLMAAAGLLATPAMAAAQKLLTTPRQMAGPFYPLELPLDNDNDLTFVEGQEGRALGQITDLTGSIVDSNGRPLANTRIEIWQCDANGRYRHPRENGKAPLDPAFQGHGHTLTNADGQYRFRTIRPVAYPGRTPHIHVAVFPQGEKPFVTQLYIADEKANQHDFLFQRIATEKRHLVVADFRPTDRPETDYQASFDIILDRKQGTPAEVS